MKNLYAICMQDANGRMTVYNIVAPSMAAATAAAQQRAGSTAEPHSAQKLSTIDFEV
jgi:hypothetical protein